MAARSQVQQEEAFEFFAADVGLSLEQQSVNLRLPKVLRYVDDYDDTNHSIRDPAGSATWGIASAGSVRKVSFVNCSSLMQPIVKQVIAHALSTLSPATASIYADRLTNASPGFLEKLLRAGPFQVQSVWNLAISDDEERHHHAFGAARTMLKVCCLLRLGEWSKEYLGIVSLLRTPTRDRYSKLRTGEVFLNPSEESRVIRFLDSCAEFIQKSPLPPDGATLEQAALIAIGYQFGMRPIQIGRVYLSDCTDRSRLSGRPNVHIVFPMAKQRNLATREIKLPRRVKLEWAVILKEHIDRRSSMGPLGATKLFSYTSAREVSVAMKAALDSIGVPGRTAYSLRHSAAQRMADAGASADDIAEFLGHVSNTTCLVYFDCSPGQAARVNKALGISPTYQRVAAVAKMRFISREELARLKEDHQIAGSPHGIPVIGIGGCECGQAACPSNPVLACYGCEKFKPVLDMEVHQEVLSTLRQVVREFEEDSRGEPGSSPFAQLRVAIEDVQGVIHQLEDEL